MQKRITNLPFRGTPEQEEKLRAIIAEHKGQQGAVMPVLQKAQEVYGYLPMEVQAMVAEGLGVSLEEVFGVSTFYSQFSLTPKGQYNISICLGTACYVKGSGKLMEKLQETLGVGVGETTEDGLFTVEGCRCVGACGLAPVMTINDKVYGHLTVDDIPRLVNEYRELAKAEEN